MAVKMIDEKLKPITEEEYLALGEDVRAEVIDGELIIDMAANRNDHSFFTARITTYLDTFASPRGLGRVFGDMGAYKLKVTPQKGLKDALVPDASYISFERLPPDAPINVILAIAPDLVVEVISESESFKTVLTKTNKYLDYGVKAVWLLIPWRREVHVCTSDNRTGIILTEKDTLTSGDVLPGFEVPIRAIFEDGNTALHAEVLRKLLGV